MHCRILCTHHTKYLSQADLIIVLDHGKIVMTGTPDEVLRNQDITQIGLELENADAASSTDQVIKTARFTISGVTQVSNAFQVLLPTPQTLSHKS